MRRFLDDYKALENKLVEVEQFRGAEPAAQVVGDSFNLCRTEKHPPVWLWLMSPEPWLAAFCGRSI